MNRLSPHGTVQRGKPLRRYIAMLFADLSDSTRLAAAMEAEEYSDLLGRLRWAYQDVISKHGGVIARVQGDGVLAIFGYPDAHEDDGRRATEAALDLHDTVRRFQSSVPSTSLGLHTGVHAGLVLVEEGDTVRGRLDLTGSAINVAARLSAVATHDEIIVGEETLSADAHFFEAGVRRILTLRGVAEPVAVYPVLARASVSTRFEARAKRGLTSFVGRETELRSLERGLADAIAGRSGYIAIAGAAGLGKTRLAEEFLHRAADARCQILRGYCESYLSAEPLQPFIQMLWSLCQMHHGISAATAAERLDRTLSDIDPDLLAYRPVLLRALSLGSAVPLDGAARQTAPETVIEATCAIFGALAAVKPLVIFIDDWQWADDATRQTLGRIRNIGRGPILVLIASRDFAPGDLAMSDLDVLGLRPLTETEAEQTISQLLPGMDPFVVQDIRDYSGGNPLFLEELCHSVAHQSTARRIGHAQAGAAWLDKLIEARVERLPADQAQLVRMAAVIGNVIPVWLLERLSGCNVHHPLVLALMKQDLLFMGESAGTLRFKHGIARDVIYDAVGLSQRMALHRQIAEVLREQGASGGEEEFYEALACHYGAARQAREAARYAELAGDKAVATSALDRAQVQYQAALAALDLLESSHETYERWIGIVQRLAFAAVFDPSREQVEILRRAVTLATSRGDAPAIARTEYWLGYLTYALGEGRVATRYLASALAYARRANDARLVAQVEATLGEACAATCDYGKSLALLDSSIRAKSQRQKGSRPAVGFAYALACKAAVHGDRGEFEQAQVCFDDALAAVRGTGHEVEGSVLCWRSGVYLWQGCWDEAWRTAVDALRVAERVRSRYLYAQSLSLGGYASWMMQRSAAALQTIVDATSWHRARGRSLFISLNYGWLADGMAASGRWAEGRAYVARTLMRSRGHDRLGEAMAYRAMARASAAGQARRPPAYYIELARRAASARDSSHEMAATQLCDAEIKLGQGDLTAAIVLLEQAGHAFRGMGMAWHLAETARLHRLCQAQAVPGATGAADVTGAGEVIAPAMIPSRMPMPIR
ncbi:hypothetical protein FHP25_05220 [Vineibacter terrae]|uniref:Guanylate cyclase domain-containing protein n=1 Tax=Vineibacter terrae TaxID=2586908 RepID=A0A5C8PTM2_9HYPH|nr:adenylate/guanylate cyclase domain-containing protein [Vineibacter terrae]TXL80429.1 hypothetical protein FHP25_05220 [Vineibacter terrae]